MKKALFVSLLIILLVLCVGCGQKYVFGANSSILENNNNNIYSFTYFRGEYSFTHPTTNAGFSIQTDISEGEVKIYYSSPHDSENVITASALSNGTTNCMSIMGSATFSFRFESAGAKGEIKFIWG